jgi:hypothetical protein
MYSFIKACMKKSSVRTQTGSFYCHAHYCHFLLILQKKVTKEKEAGKENRYCFSPIAHCHFPLQKTVTVRTFSGLPPHHYNQSTAIVLYPHTNLPQLALSVQG